MSIEVTTVVDDAAAELWRQVHNTVIPATPLTSSEVRDRRRRNRLTLAHAAGVLVGNATVRPATDQRPPTVIVRILPEHRRHGYGTEYLQRLLTDVPALRAGDLATVVLCANHDGLSFARRHGFVEVERYQVGGAEYADLVRRR